MPTTPAFAPTAADLAEFYFDPVGAAHADDDAAPPPAQPEPAAEAGPQG
ncbi:MAG: hypothetical protein IH625_04810 [Rhodobacteraceae bacterium]|nr:hypothetical protein [Paracoccaceae bacterium]